ncbi:MAG: hypothetical protein ACI80V_003700 [Rhodothermales bacterium]|jgi:hypothetical protein
MPRFLLPLTFLLAGCTAQTPQPTTPTGWVLEDSTLWSQDAGTLELIKPGAQVFYIRRPGALAYLGGTTGLTDFRLTAEIRGTSDSTIVGRDVIVVFGYESPTRFYYAHLSNDNTIYAHNGIFVVDGADRRRIDTPGLASPPQTRLNDTAWHQVEVRRHVASGRIEVFMDDPRRPLMTAMDTSIGRGAVGFGSFDDTGAIRNLEIVEGAPAIADPVRERVETGGLTLQLTPFASIPLSDPDAQATARINFLSDAGDGTGRLFVNDLRGTLYQIDNGVVTPYLDLAGGDDDFGLMYASVGDGETPGAQSDGPQSLASIGGKILRINPAGTDASNGQYGIPAANPFAATGGALGEIWAMGLRNPHRFSWDPETGRMFIGHIGEANTDGILEGFSGANFGWNVRENGFRYEKEEPSKTWPLPEGDAGFTYPVARVDHDDGGAVVGGFVYRGKALPALAGKYLFGDIVFGSVFYVDADSMQSGRRPARVRKATLVDEEGVAHGFDHFAGIGRADLRFGRDAAGELYLLSKANGSIWAITGAVQASERLPKAGPVEFS